MTTSTPLTLNEPIFNENSVQIGTMTTQTSNLHVSKEETIANLDLEANSTAFNSLSVTLETSEISQIEKEYEIGSPRSADQSEISENQYFSANETNQAQSSASTGSSSTTTTTATSSASESSSSTASAESSPMKSTTTSNSYITNDENDESFKQQCAGADDTINNKTLNNETINNAHNNSHHTVESTINSNNTYETKNINDDELLMKSSNNNNNSNSNNQIKREENSSLAAQTIDYIESEGDYPRLKQIKDNDINLIASNNQEINENNIKKDEETEIAAAAAVVNAVLTLPTVANLIKNYENTNNQLDDSLNSTKTFNSNMSDLEIKSNVTSKSSTCSGLENLKITSMDIEGDENLCDLSTNTTSDHDSEYDNNVEQNLKLNQQQNDEQNVAAKILELEINENLNELVHKIVTDVVKNAVNLVQDSENRSDNGVIIDVVSKQEVQQQQQEATEMQVEKFDEIDDILEEVKKLENEAKQYEKLIDELSAQKEQNEDVSKVGDNFVEGKNTVSNGTPQKLEAEIKDLLVNKEADVVSEPIDMDIQRLDEAEKEAQQLENEANHLVDTDVTTPENVTDMEAEERNKQDEQILIDLLRMSNEIHLTNFDADKIVTNQLENKENIENVQKVEILQQPDLIQNLIELNSEETKQNQIDVELQQSKSLQQSPGIKIIDIMSAAQTNAQETISNTKSQVEIEQPENKNLTETYDNVVDIVDLEQKMIKALEKITNETKQDSFVAPRTEADIIIDLNDEGIDLTQDTAQDQLEFQSFKQELDNLKASLTNELERFSENVEDIKLREVNFGDNYKEKRDEKAFEEELNKSFEEELNEQKGKLSNENAQLISTQEQQQLDVASNQNGDNLNTTNTTIVGSPTLDTTQQSTSKLIKEDNKKPKQPKKTQASEIDCFGCIVL